MFSGRFKLPTFLPFKVLTFLVIWIGCNSVSVLMVAGSLVWDSSLFLVPLMILQVLSLVVACNLVRAVWKCVELGVNKGVDVVLDTGVKIERFKV